MDIGKRLAKLDILVQDVDKYNEEDSDVSLITLEYIKDQLEELEIELFAVVPHAEGLTIIFIDPCHYKYCALEILNVGITLSVMISSISSSPEIKLLEDIDEVQEELKNIALFLRGQK